jgi:two-component system phosphate regulon response regulator PhoB
MGTGVRSLETVTRLPCTCHLPANPAAKTGSVLVPYNSAIGSFGGERVSMPRTILVVEDEKDILELIRFSLAQADFRVLTATDGRQGLETARRSLPDLVILDLMLPLVPGTDVARALKSDDKTRGIPILMLTARSEEVDRIVGFELGADDYVVKPFSPRELILRVQAILRREVVDENERPITFPPLVIDLVEHCVRLSGRELDLTGTEFKLLHRLARRPGRAFSRDQLLSEVWGYTEDVESRTVDTHVKRLRAKLGRIGDWIQTVRGVGYRFRPDGVEAAD